MKQEALYSVQVEETKMYCSEIFQAVPARPPNKVEPFALKKLKLWEMDGLNIWAELLFFSNRQLCTVIVPYKNPVSSAQQHTSYIRGAKQLTVHFSLPAHALIN